MFIMVGNKNTYVKTINNSFIVIDRDECSTIDLVEHLNFFLRYCSGDPTRRQIIESFFSEVTIKSGWRGSKDSYTIECPTLSPKVVPLNSVRLFPLGKSRLHLVEVLQLIQYLLTNTRLNDADDPRLELIKRFNPQFSFDPPGSIMRKILDRWEQWASERFLSSDDS